MWYNHWWHIPYHKEHYTGVHVGNYKRGYLVLEVTLSNRHIIWKISSWLWYWLEKNWKTWTYKWRVTKTLVMRSHEYYCSNTVWPSISYHVTECIHERFHITRVTCPSLCNGISHAPYAWKKSCIQCKISSKWIRFLLNVYSNHTRLISIKVRNTKTFYTNIVIQTTQGMSLKSAQSHLLLTLSMAPQLTGFPRNRYKLHREAPTLIQEQCIHEWCIKTG